MPRNPRRPAPAHSEESQLDPADIHVGPMSRLSDLELAMGPMSDALIDEMERRVESHQRTLSQRLLRGSLNGTVLTDPINYEPGATYEVSSMSPSEVRRTLDAYSRLVTNSGLVREVASNSLLVPEAPLEEVPGGPGSLATANSNPVIQEEESVEDPGLSHAIDASARRMRDNLSRRIFATAPSTTSTFSSSGVTSNQSYYIMAPPSNNESWASRFVGLVDELADPSPPPSPQSLDRVNFFIDPSDSDFRQSIVLALGVNSAVGAILSSGDSNLALQRMGLNDPILEVIGERMVRITDIKPDQIVRRLATCCLRWVRLDQSVRKLVPEEISRDWIDGEGGTILLHPYRTQQLYTFLSKKYAGLLGYMRRPVSFSRLCYNPDTDQILRFSTDDRISVLPLPDGYMPARQELSFALSNRTDLSSSSPMVPGCDESRERLAISRSGEKVEMIFQNVAEGDKFYKYTRRVPGRFITREGVERLYRSSGHTNPIEEIPYLTCDHPWTDYQDGRRTRELTEAEFLGFFSSSAREQVSQGS